MKGKSALLILLLFTSCFRVSPQIEPCITAPKHPKEVMREKRCVFSFPENFSKSPFPCLSGDEVCQDWGKEYLMALSFAEDFDLYRAITNFKRALFLLPEEKKERRMEIEYMIALSYYLGKKYVEVIYEIQSTELVGADYCFPAFSDLLLILYDSYDKMGKLNERDHILSIIESSDCEKGEKLFLLKALSSADFPKLEIFAKKKASIDSLLCCYEQSAKSVRKAEFLNAVLPGAGYLYVGQKQTAITAFLINSLFIGAAVAFFENGYNAAGIITLSLESGWYFGGIYGAGLAAKYYNERLYESCVERVATNEGLFPIMMLRYSF